MKFAVLILLLIQLSILQCSDLKNVRKSPKNSNRHRLSKKKHERRTLERTDYTYTDELTPLRINDYRIGSLQHHGYELYMYKIFQVNHCHFRLGYSTQDSKQCGQNCRCSLKQHHRTGDHERCNVTAFDINPLKAKLLHQGDFSYDCNSNEILYNYHMAVEKGDYNDCHYNCINMFMRNVNHQHELPTEAEKVPA